MSLTDPKIIEKINESGHAFLCAICKAKISEKRYLVSMKGETPYHTFTNPHGFEFNILTVVYCEMVEEASREYTEHTWFPGYAWTIIACSHCREHLGWKFTSAEREPHLFYGLIRDKLILSGE